MRILLIGGSGFVGTPLSRELAAGGHEVAIFHRASASSLQPGARHIRVDRHRLTDFFRPIKDFAPDVIVDLVLSSGEQARLLMQLAGVLRARVVALSSMDVYRAWGVIHRVESVPLEPLPITEDSPLRTTRKLYSPESTKAMQSIFTWLSDDYDKIAVEEEILQTATPGAVLRLPMLYGPGDPLHRCLPVVKRVMDGRPAMILPEDFAAWRGPRGYVETLPTPSLWPRSPTAPPGGFTTSPSNRLFLSWSGVRGSPKNWAGRGNSLFSRPRAHPSICECRLTLPSMSWLTRIAFEQSWDSRKSLRPMRRFGERSPGRSNIRPASFRRNSTTRQRMKR